MIVSKKRISLIVIISILLVLSSSLTVYPQPLDNSKPVDYGPQWDNITNLTINLTINSGKAMISCRVVGKPGVTGITAVAILERQEAGGSYTEIKRWDGLSSSSSTLMFDQPYYVSRGYTYRLTFTAIVYRDGIGEMVSDSRSAYAY